MRLKRYWKFRFSAIQLCTLMFFTASQALVIQPEKLQSGTTEKLRLHLSVPAEEADLAGLTLLVTVTGEVSEWEAEMSPSGVWSQIQPVLQKTSDGYRLGFLAPTFTDGNHQESDLGFITFTGGGFDVDELQVVNAVDVSGQKMDLSIQMNPVALKDKNPGREKPDYSIKGRTHVLRFMLGSSAFISITIRDMKGRVVNTLASEKMQQGLQVVSWDETDSYGKQMPAGNYLLDWRQDGYAYSRLIQVKR